MNIPDILPCFIIIKLCNMLYIPKDIVFYYTDNSVCDN